MYKCQYVHIGLVHREHRSHGFVRMQLIANVCKYKMSMYKTYEPRIHGFVRIQ